MPTADVVVTGAGLAGLACAVDLAERGASVFLAAKGMATTHWTHGGLDVAAPPGAATAVDGIARLAGVAGHPYAWLADDVPPAISAHLRRLESAGLPSVGELGDPLRPVPTAIGTLRPASILPAAQGAALPDWADAGLLLVGFEGFRDAWPTYAARNLAGRQWEHGPTRIRATDVRLEGLAELRTLNAVTVARLFDQPSWRSRALRTIAGAVPAGRWRVALPAVLGLADHAAVLAEATVALGGAPIELPSVPPSVPGMRLYEALRSRLLARGGRMQWGFPVVDVERRGDRITAIHTEGAARTLRLAGDAFVLATGGIAGGGLRATPDGRLHETVFGLPVSALPHGGWFSTDGLAAQPIDAAGIVVDDELRSVDGPRNVHVIGSALAGMRYLDERCGDGVALASAHRVARVLGRAGAAASVRAEGVA